jgi:uncharacterized protein
MVVSFVAAMAVWVAACGSEPGSPSLDQQAAEAGSAVRLPLTGPVVDEANIIPDEEENILSGKLAALERATHHQMVVVTVKSLEGEEIKPFTTNLANSLGVGRRGYNDGVVLLVAPNERKMRIAVGLGLEVSLPDDLCQQIIDQS